MQRQHKGMLGFLVVLLVFIGGVDAGPTGDFNGDGIVTVEDGRQWVRLWQELDVTGDGKVDHHDLIFMVQEGKDMPERYALDLSNNKTVTVPGVTWSLDYNEAVSYAFWFKSAVKPQGSAAELFVSAWTGFGNHFYHQIKLATSGKVYLEARSTAGVLQPRFVQPGKQSPDICDDQWHFVVITHPADLSNMKLYVDGDLIAVDSSIPGYVPADQPPVWRSVGLLDNPACFGKVLTLSEVQTLYNSGQGRLILADEFALIWAGNCNDGEGTTVTDVAGQHDGVLNTAAAVWLENEGPPFPTAPPQLSLLGVGF